MAALISLKQQSPKWAAWLMLFLWLVYTLVYTLPFEANLGAILEALAGSLGVVALLFFGFSRQDLFLQLKPISKPGGIALALATVLIAAPLSLSSWVGVRWLPLLVYAPLSGITQELFFRGSLLPAIQRLCGGRSWLPLILQAVLFGLWHVPLAYLAAPISPWVAVLALFVVTTLAGIAWGWQAQHDRTVAWTMLDHTFMLMLMSLFGL